MPKNPIIYLNNLRAKKNWRSDPRELMWSRSIPPLALNIFTTIMVINFDQSDLEMLRGISENIDQMTLRFGFIFLNAPDHTNRILSNLNQKGLLKALAVVSIQSSFDVSLFEKSDSSRRI
jgi:hypothetical protein